MRTRVREYLGWVESRDQLKDQPIDPLREQMLATETESSRRRIPDAVRQAYSVVVTVDENNTVHAFKVVVTGEPLFTIIKPPQAAYSLMSAEHPDKQGRPAQAMALDSALQSRSVPGSGGALFPPVLDSTASAEAPPGTPAIPQPESLVRKPEPR